MKRADGAEVLVHVQGSTRRALQPLFEARRQMIKLGLFTLALGLALVWWTIARLVKPVEQLRAEVLRRASEAVPRAGIDLGRRDEVGDLAEAFNTVLTALGERSRANEAFLADIAHEFKNPVAAIRASAERLAEVRPDDAARLKLLAEVLHQSARRLDGLLNQLLDLARVEAGLQNEHRSLIDLRALVAGLCESIRADLRYPDLRVEASLPEHEVQVEGVPDRIESAIRNVLDNAASFAGAGGSVHVTLSLDPSAVRVRVSDSGPGISAADLPRVFDRFFTTRRDSNGTGLGLSMVRAVVEAHGGNVEAQSPEGSGAELTLSFPPTRPSPRQ